ncbi:hypothetical protein EW026_g5188 [Hermanssonia centrifuga]|uniref:ABC transporter domain-containing protein n=1 Tax=Hermanssonia centrifuga TaxID=98765 RepID=A0A4V3XA51_9APHY|nr:hypothetical protein EW026_g5188 [Hermanssonia centrifuga]
MKPMKIVATSQQSRFHTETLDIASGEIDLKDVTIAVGERELLTDTRLKLKEGIRYALVGRNGTGKSTLLQALSDKLIPGLSKSLRIVLVSQVTDSTRDEQGSANSEDISVLMHVVHGDKQRGEAMREFEELTLAVDATSLAKTQRIVSEITLLRLEIALDDARKVASRTSGARGKKARAEEIKAEDRVKEANEK